jgi:Tol biopolymer transport system component
LIGHDDFDGLLGRWLEAQAPRGVPDGLLETVGIRVGATPRRPAWRVLDHWVGPAARAGFAPVRRVGILVLVAVALAALLGATLLAVGSFHRPSPFRLAGNGLIAFDAAGPSSSASVIYVEDVASGTRRALTPPGSQSRTARFSPDGATIAFWSRPSTDAPWSLMAVDASGANLRTIAGSWAAVGSIAWASDSVHLAFDATVGFGSRIFRARRDSTGALPIGDPAMSASDPAWSPDGRSITFRGDVPGQGFTRMGVYVMAADGTTVLRVSRVVATTDYDFLAPGWSPDGSTIVAVVGDATSFDVWAFAADGSAERRIAGGPADEIAPAWSPDGSKVAYLRGTVTNPDALAAHHRPDLRGGGFNVVVANPDGSDPRVLPGPLVDDRPLRWSPDGSHVLGYLPAVDGVFDGSDDRIVVLGDTDAPPVLVALGGAASDAGDWQRVTP